MHGRGVIKGRSGRRLLRRAAHRVTCARRTTARGGPLVVANSSSSTQAYRSIDAVGRPHPGCRWHRRGTSSRVVACVAGRPLLFCVCTVGSAPRAQGRRRSAAAGLERATRRAHRANGAFPLVAQLIDQLACMQGVHANHSTPQHIHASPPPTSSQTTSCWHSFSQQQLQVRSLRPLCGTLAAPIAVAAACGGSSALPKRRRRPRRSSRRAIAYKAAATGAPRARDALRMRCVCAAVC